MQLRCLVRVCLGLTFAALLAGCGDSGSLPASGPGGGGGLSGTGGQAVGGGGSAAQGGSTGGGAGTTSGGGMGGSAGMAGSGGTTVEPMIPGGPDEPIPADPGEQPFIHPLFTDHMVLQRDAHTPIWGWSAPGDVVTVKIAGETFTATADQHGRWLVRIGPFEADGTAHTLEVSGPQSVSFTDVKFGDVWLCSGQSNMEFVVNATPNSAAEIAASENPDLRYFLVKRINLREPRQTFQVPGATWTVVGPQNIGGFSAACYYMVRELQKKLAIPMGMIGSYWGGTASEWWTSAEAMAKVEDFTKPLADRPATVDPNQPQLTSLYNGMIAPLLPYGLKGIAWYQGESNAGNPWQYQRLMPLMIEDWRTRFRMGKLPFLQVQLANFRANGGAPEGPFDQNSGWAVLRESQLLTKLADDKVGMAVIADVGNPTDIHPINKQDVGLRLAASALHVAYEQDVVFEGPVFESFQAQGNKLQISFTQTGGGLMIGTKEANNPTPVVENVGGTLNGFALAGADGMWKLATATIDAGGKTVSVTSAEVAAPVAVRYGWHDNPNCNLYNREGLMATPFRSDTEYRVAVVDGNGGAVLAPGKTLSISANPAPQNQTFDKWVGDAAALADPSKATTTVTVPKAYVSVRATYKP